jgi:hypothetical protein
MSQGPIRTTAQPVASQSANFAANNAGAQIKTGPGVFASLNVNTVGVTSSITLYDGTSTAGKKLGTYSTLALGQQPQNLAFTAGLFAVLAGGTPADVTVGFR